MLQTSFKLYWTCPCSVCISGISSPPEEPRIVDKACSIRLDFANYIIHKITHFFDTEFSYEHIIDGFPRWFTVFISRQTGIRAFFRQNKSPGKQKSEHFFAGTQEKPEQAIGSFSCSGLLFHFLILWIADARNGRRLALHRSRQEHWDVIGCFRLFYQFSYRSCRSRPRIICISSSLSSKSKIS